MLIIPFYGSRETKSGVPRWYYSVRTFLTFSKRNVCSFFEFWCLCLVWERLAGWGIFETGKVIISQSPWKGFPGHPTKHPCSHMLLLSTGWRAPCGWDYFTKQDRISLFSSTTHHEREKDGALSSPGFYIETSPLMCFVNLSFWQSITFQLCCLAWLSSSCLLVLYSPSSLSSLIPNLGDSSHSHATTLPFHFLLAKYKSAFSYYISTKYTHTYYIPVSSHSSPGERFGDQ